MNHLGQRLSALIDGELSAAERDRVLAHLAGCDECRHDAAALRALKQRMHSLGEAMADAALTGRLMAMAAAGEAGEARRAWRPRAVYAAARWLAAGLVASAMIGVGAAAFFVGGEQQDPGPKVTPAVDSFLVQHGIVTGDVPAPAPGETAQGEAAPGGTAAGGTAPGGTVAARTGATGQPAAAAAAASGTTPSATAVPGAPAATTAARAAGRASVRASAAPSATRRATGQVTRRVTARAAWSGPGLRGTSVLLLAAAGAGP